MREGKDLGGGAGSRISPGPAGLEEQIEALVADIERRLAHHISPFWQHFREGQLDALRQVQALLARSAPEPEGRRDP